MSGFHSSLPRSLLQICLHGRYLCRLLRCNVLLLALDVRKRWLWNFRLRGFYIGGHGSCLRLPRSDLRQSWLLLLRTMGNVEFPLFTNSFPCTNDRRKCFGICEYIFNTARFFLEKMLFFSFLSDVLFRLDFRKRELCGIRF